jgi:hypothetical protein
MKHSCISSVRVAGYCVVWDVMSWIVKLRKDKQSTLEGISMLQNDLIEASHRPMWSEAELIAFARVKMHQVLWISRHAPDYHSRSSKARQRARSWARLALSEQMFGGESVMKKVQEFRKHRDTYLARAFADRVENHVQRWAWGEGLNVEAVIKRYMRERDRREEDGVDLASMAQVWQGRMAAIAA